ncbi:hypothetical protein P691DRAFT_808827 [Macrolepiota fuliginosa MF-IS2]|uniref:Uncharacterized protein n=1 Tax=Macrolepiota fuliginosa MF-IS2 TaxID=1400762 RepID=A0A9P6BX07_9AGAR|nr:hypothetical protein P691DRAFT_808827 [Macrolepiota fuliginosa MF-IS2]
MSASFEGASNFSISGGNFNRASGSVLTYNINPNSNRSKRRGSLPNLISADAATSSEGHARRRDRREESLQRPPPSPIASATSTPSHTFTVTASSNRPLSTRPTSTARHPPTPIRYTLSTSHQSSFANHTSSDPAPSALPPSSVAHTSEHGDDGINDPSNPLIIPPHPLPPPPFNTSHNAPLPPLGSLMNGENDITAPQLSQNWRPPSTSSWAPLIQPSTLGPSSRGNSTTFHYASSLSPGPQLGNGRLVNMVSDRVPLLKGRGGEAKRE